MQGGDAVVEPEPPCAFPGALQEGGGAVDGDDLRFGEDLGEEAGDDAGACADVEHPADLRRVGQGGDPARRLGVLRAAEFGVPLQERGHDVPVGFGPAVVVPVRGALVVQALVAVVVVSVAGVVAHESSVTTPRSPRKVPCCSGKPPPLRYSCGLTPRTRLKAVLNANAWL